MYPLKIVSQYVCIAMCITGSDFDYHECPNDNCARANKAPLNLRNEFVCSKFVG